MDELERIKKLAGVDKISSDDSMGENSSASNSTNRTIKNLSKIVDPKKEFSITIVAVPKQINGYDCGMYCICFSEMIIDELIKLAKKYTMEMTIEIIIINNHCISMKNI